MLVAWRRAATSELHQPLYSPSGPSLCTIIFPVAKKPLGLVPGFRWALRLNCIRTLMVSRLRRWQEQRSHQSLGSLCGRKSSVKRALTDDRHMLQKDQPNHLRQSGWRAASCSWPWCLAHCCSKTTVCWTSWGGRNTVLFPFVVNGRPTTDFPGPFLSQNVRWEMSGPWLVRVWLVLAGFLESDGSGALFKAPFWLDGWICGQIQDNNTTSWLATRKEGHQTETREALTGQSTKCGAQRHMNCHRSARAPAGKSLCVREMTLQCLPSYPGPPRWMR